MHVRCPSIHLRVGGAVLAISVAASLSACSPRDDTAARTDSAVTDLGEQAGAELDTAAAAGAVAADTMANRVSGALDGTNWSDADIVAYLVAVDSGEIVTGELASSKATSAPVKAFAKQVVSDHQKHLDNIRQFASTQSIDIAAATRDDIRELRDDAANALKDLTDKDAGADWDEDFVNKQVDVHQTVIDRVNDFTKATQSTQLRDMLQQTLPTLQAHLKTAQDLQGAKLAS